MGLLDRFKAFGKSLSEDRLDRGPYGESVWKPLRSLRTDWKATEYLKAYETSAYVYACVKKRGEKVAQTRFTLKARYSGDDIDEHWLLDILERPNPHQSGAEFFEQFQSHKDLAGSAFILKAGVGKDGRPVELHLLRPDHVTVKVDEKDGSIVAYEYVAGGRKAVYKPEDVIASHFPSPLGVHLGHSPLRSGALAVDVEDQLSQYHFNVLKNGGKVEGVVTYSTESMTQQQVDEIRARIEEQYGGSNKSGKPLVLYGGASYQNLGLTPTELSFLESKRMTRDDITTIYSVPKELLGLGAEGGFQATAFDGATRAFLAHTVKPLVENMVQKLNVFLAPDDVELGFIDPTPEDVEQKLKVVASGTTDGYMTVNEKREFMGLEPVEGGDVIMVSMGLIPLDDALAEPDPEPEPVAPPSPVEPPKPEGEPEPEQEPEAPPQAKGHVRMRHPLLVKANRVRYGREKSRKLRARTEEGLKVARRLLSKQKQRVLERLEDKTPAIKALDRRTWEGGTEEQWAATTKGIADDVFDRSAEVAAFSDGLLPYVEKWAKAAGTEAMLFSGRKPPFKITSRLKATLAARADLFASRAVDTAYKKVERAISKAIEAGEGREGMVANIRKVYGEMSRGHANTIARTEVHVASQSGTVEGYRQSGVPIKIWVAVQDAATRDSHSDMDGEEAPIDMPFSNGLMHPGDPSGSAEETINCRCQV